MILVLIGPQASGKGTQSEKLAEKLNLNHIEMGGILRKVARENTPLGRKINELINKKGVLVPDKLIFQIIDNYLNKFEILPGIIFDGFPRVISQAKYLEKFLKSKGKTIDIVIYLRLPKKQTFKRLISRRICEKCGRVFNLITNPPKKEGVCDFCFGKLVKREDETPEKIKTRLKEFETQTKPLIDFYKKRKILEEVDGDQPIDLVFNDIVSILKKRGLVGNEAV